MLYVSYAVCVRALAQGARITIHHSTAQHNTTQHNTTQHNITLIFQLHSPIRTLFFSFYL